MQKSLGAFIRQLRREQNKTQSQLGGTAFSKSYVSAVESDKLVPSEVALRHFASSLGKPEHYFLALAAQTKGQAPVPLMEAVAVLEPEAIASLLHEKMALLATLFDHTEYGELEASEAIFSLQSEVIDALAPQDQAHYYFFQSLVLQRKNEYTAAIESLEQALARENHPQHTASILYALAKCYTLLHLPHISLNYAIRSYHLFRQHASVLQASLLPFRITLQVGAVFLALSLYQPALEYLEQARTLLNDRQPMRDVEQLYRNLGYCAYGLAFQKQVSSISMDHNEVERLYQQALGYFLQSRTIAQMAEDRHGEKSLRLAQARMQLDRVIWHRRCYKQGTTESLPPKGLGLATLSSLLDEASEQCRQVLSAFLASSLSTEQERAETLSNVYYALALLLQVGVQRALLAYEQGYENTFKRECSLAAALCQQALDACRQEALLATIAWNGAHLTEMVSPLPSLPRLPELIGLDKERAESVRLAQAEIYFAAGEVAEMLARTATTPHFARDCYKNADVSFLRALEELRNNHMLEHMDVSGSLTRTYQRYTLLMEERLHHMVEQGNDGYHATDLFFSVCQSHLLHSPGRLPSSFLIVPHQPVR